MQTKAYAQWPFARAAEYLDEKYSTSENFRTISLKKDAQFVSLVPRHWVPRDFKGELGHVPANKNPKFNYDATVRKVAKLLGYIKARKMNIKNNAKTQKDKYKKEALQVTKALLARYRPILSPTVITKLESNRNKWSKEVTAPNQTPNMGAKFLSKVLRRRLNFKVERGKPARLRNLEFTASVIGPKNIVRENRWKVAKGAPAPGPRRTPSPPAKLTNTNLQAAITSLVFQAGNAYERRQWANLARLKKTASPLLRDAMSRRQIRNFTLQARAALANLQSNQNTNRPAAPAKSKAKSPGAVNKQLVKKTYEAQFGNKFDLRKLGAYEKKTGMSAAVMAQSIRAGTPLPAR
jgi:hypothetical protein